MSKPGAPIGNTNNSKRPSDAEVANYERAMRAGELTRAQMAAAAGVDVTTTYRWIPAFKQRQRREAKPPAKPQSAVAPAWAIRRKATDASDRQALKQLVRD